MSICLPNLRSTSVFKVYYGGTGQTSLTEGGVVIGNGTDAVQCVTGSSDGQVLTWDASQNTWLARDSSAGNGTGISIGNAVKTPPTDVRKKKISNIEKGTKIPVIDWYSTNNGTFRISAYDPNKKYVTIYNNSQKDLYISVANDENPKLVIDFEEINNINNINISYVYESSSAETTLFNYKINDLTSIYSHHTHSQEPNIKYGYGKDYSLNICGSKAQLVVSLTKDFFSYQINKYNQAVTGSYVICLSSSSGKSDSTIINVSCSSDYLYNNYSIYTKNSGSTFINSNIQYMSCSNLINGFDLSDSSLDTKLIPPDFYSYKIFSDESVTLTEEEACLSIFGYTLEPDSATEEVSVMVTEAR